MFLRASTCSQSRVARLPIGVNFGPRSLPMTLAWIIASRTMPSAWLASMDSAPTSTVGMLFMTDDRNAIRRPVPNVAPHTPYPADRSSNVARSEEHTSELPSLKRISYPVSCLHKTKHLHE